MSDLLIDRVIQDFADPVPASSLTVLFPFRSFGERMQALSVYCVNVGAFPVTFTLEGSETTANADPEKTFPKVAAPGEQVSFDLVDSNMMVTNWRLSAATESPTFPTTSVKFKIKGQSSR